LKFECFFFLENLSRKFQFPSNRKRITGTLDADQYTFLIISRSLLRRMRNVSAESCKEYQNTYFIFSNGISKIVPFMR